MVNLYLEGSFHQSSSCGTIWSHSYRGMYNVGNFGLSKHYKPFFKFIELHSCRLLRMDYQLLQPKMEGL